MQVGFGVAINQQLFEFINNVGLWTAKPTYKKAQL